MQAKANYNHALHFTENSSYVYIYTANIFYLVDHKHLIHGYASSLIIIILWV